MNGSQSLETVGVGPPCSFLVAHFSRIRGSEFFFSHKEAEMQRGNIPKSFSTSEGLSSGSRNSTADDCATLDTL